MMVIRVFILFSILSENEHKKKTWLKFEIVYYYNVVLVVVVSPLCFVLLYMTFIYHW